MVAHINTVAFQGIEAFDVDVQVSILSGLPSFIIVSLPVKAVGESRERVRADFGAIGLALPPKRVTVNLAPADMLKEGSHLDLPIALGLLTAMDVIGADDMADYAALGELGLDGALIPVAGVLLAAVKANAKHLGLICPQGNGAEAAWAGGGDVIAARPRSPIKGCCSSTNCRNSRAPRSMPCASRPKPDRSRSPGSTPMSAVRCAFSSSPR